MRFFASLLAVVCFAAVAHTQTLTKNPEATGAVTPEDMTKRLEQTADRTRKINPSGAPRAAQFDFAWPQDEDEYRKLAKHVIVLVSVVVRDEKELPLKRVYIRNKWNREFPLDRIVSERREVAQGSLTHSVLGAYREDSFYLAPAGLMKGEGEVVADFAANRTGFRLYHLPGTPPDFIEADRRPMPAPGARPEPKALKAILEREYAGFRLPDGLP
ncbi:MAG TPA: hypothetical protein VNQ34_02890 [Xanthobacteraceae bacterium]|jgi:hypothetical protein|nr:hypothetical protein [Xanthobacteraceae bacterium]